MSHLGETGRLAIWEGAGEGGREGDTSQGNGSGCANQRSEDEAAAEIRGGFFHNKK